VAALWRDIRLAPRTLRCLPGRRQPTVRFRPSLSPLCPKQALGPDQIADLFFDLVHFWKAIQGVLGEDLFPVEKDFERSRLTGSKRYRPELIVVIVQQILRQTGGSR